MVKVWNVVDGDKGKQNVSLVTSRDLGVVRAILSSNIRKLSCVNYRAKSSLRLGPLMTLLPLPQPVPRPSYRYGTLALILALVRRLVPNFARLAKF